MPDNPFSNAFNPDRGGLTGFIGGLMGNPTNSEAAGGATSAALSQLSELKGQGLNNQQALLKFFQTPEGHDFFVNAGPDGLKHLTDGLTATTAPAPVITDVGPGHDLYATTPGSGTNKVATNPQQFPNQVLGPQDKLVNGSTTLNENTNDRSDDPADVKSFKFFTELAKMPKEEIQRLAGIKANNPSDKKAAVDDMLRRGVVSPDLANSLMAETISITKLGNGYGQDTGDIVVYDKSHPERGSQLIPAGSGASAISGVVNPTAVPGTTPSTGAATGVLPQSTLPPMPMPGQPGGPEGPLAPTSKVNDRAGFGNGKDMALGVGPVANVLGAATKVSEAIDPRLIIDQGAQANDRMTAYGTLKSNLQAVGTIGGGMSSNKARIDGYVNTFLDEGFFSSPHSQVGKLIRLSEITDKNIAEEATRAADKSLPNEVRKQAAETIAAWQRVQTSMPDYEYLIKQEADIRNGTAGAPTIVGGAKAIMGAAAKGITEIQKQKNELSGNGEIDWSQASPQQLQATDPATLSPTGAIKYKQRIQALIAARKNGSSKP